MRVVYCRILLVARLCYAMPELVPRLQQCILGPVEWKKQEALRYEFTCSFVLQDWDSDREWHVAP